MLRNRSTLPIFVTLPAAFWLAATACDSDRANGPTAPRLPTPPSLQAASWSGEWFLGGATPADDCLTEPINAAAANGFTMRVGVAFERDGANVVVRLLHGPGNEPYEGFWPLEFRGTIDADGHVKATVPASSVGAIRQDPWLEFCSSSWSIESGELAAVLSQDGRTLTGATTETYRVVDPAHSVVFTVNGRLVAVAP